jgi:DNA mismatch repair protein MSH4
MSPSNIIFPSTVCPSNRQSGLFQRVKETMPAYQVDGFDRSAWSESDGVEYIENLAFSTDIGPIKVAIEGKFYATTSFSAVSLSEWPLNDVQINVSKAMKYIEQNLEITFAHNSLRISYTPSEDTMMIDISAFQSLEVMQNLRDAKSKSCLFGLLNTTLTPMGSRMLRSNILQPPTNQENFIIPRYEALAELTSNEEMFRDIRQCKISRGPSYC